MASNFSPVERYSAHRYDLQAAIDAYAKKHALNIESVCHDYNHNAWLLWHKLPRPETKEV